MKTQDEFDKRCRALNGKRPAYSSTALNEYLVVRGLDAVARQTITNHRKHVQHPQDKLVTEVEQSQRRAIQSRPETSHDEFLQALVDIGARRIMENPEDVTVDQALKAAKIQVDKEKKGQSNNVLVQLFTTTSEPPTVVVEGESQEV